MNNYLTLPIKNYIENYSGLPKNCWLGIGLTLIDALTGGVSFFLAIYFVSTLYFDVFTAGLLISIYGIGTTTGGLLGGKLTDKLSPEIVSLASLFIQSIMYLLLIWAHAFQLIAFILFILGIGSYGFKTSNSIWMLNQCKKSEIRLKTININRAASNLGLGLAGVAIGLLSDVGFQSIFCLCSLFLFIASVYPLLQKNTSETSIIIHGNPPPQNEINFNKENNKIVFLMIACMFAIGLIITQLSSTYPIYIQNTFPELNVKAVSILFTLDTIIIVLFQAPLANYFKQYNKICIVGVGALFMGLGMLLLSISSLFSLAILSCILWTTGEMLFISTAQIVCYEKGKQGKKGHTMGLFQAFYAASRVIGSILGGMIYQYGSGNMLWYLCGAIGISCYLACNYYKSYN